MRDETEVTLRKRPWPSDAEAAKLPCSCVEGGAKNRSERCGDGWTRCNTRLAAISDWQRAALEQKP